MTEQQIRFNDGAAYERMMGTWSRPVGNTFLDWLAPAAGLRWIDIGCGSGAFTELVIERCAPAEVQGIDPSEAQLAFARTRPGARMAQFRRGDAMALPFPENSFDAAIMALVIFFVPDPAKGVAEMVRVVAPGGHGRDLRVGHDGRRASRGADPGRDAGDGPDPVAPAEPCRIADRSPAGSVDRCRSRRGRNAGDHGAADIRRFRRFLDNQPDGAKRWPDRRGDAPGRCRTAQGAGARAPAGGCFRAHHLRGTRQRGKGV
jgi:SAM-dependent methyltransferase